MKIKLSIDEFNNGLSVLSSKYDIYAPRVFEKRGTHSDTDSIRYDKVSNFQEMEFSRKSHFSAKETFLPINQLLFYFVENDYREAAIERKDIIVFLRTCDMHAVKRIDKIYLENGTEDYYYKRLRDKVKFVVVGCKESFRNCFCVSMGTNKPENYDMGMNLDNEYIFLDICDESLNVFEGVEVEFELDYVSGNNFSVNVPEKVDFMKIKDHEMWNEYDSRCIGCGRCNFSCPTCTCFSMQDIYYKENENIGERRRVWASCQVDGYTNIAGGHSFRNKQGERMRFKTMHKIHDFKERFGMNMCVGCGRCDDMCPQYISFSSAIEKLNNVIEEEK